MIDCWENEPDISRELLELADIATPHIAGYSADGKWSATRMSIENLIRYFSLEVTPRYASIPEPAQPLIDLQDIPAAAQLPHAVWHSYDPTGETAALKASPESFYRFRSTYPLRREYHAFTVRHAGKQISERLLQLGFKVE